jgi:hypothetical protein
MRRGVVAAVVVGIGLLAALGCSAAELTEIGIQLSLVQQPLLTEGHQQFGASLGVYAKLRLDAAWTLRGALYSPLGVWMPGLLVAGTYGFADRWAGEAELTIQGDPGAWLQSSLNVGVRAVVARGLRSRLMLFSFPVALSVMWFQDRWTVQPVLTPNLFVDLAWMPRPRIILGQALGVSLVGPVPGIDRGGLLLGEDYTLVLRSLTRVGFVP